DPVWKTDTQKNKAELERVAFYHCDQVGTPQTLSNELGECIWEIKQDTWGTALEIKAIEQDNPFGHSNIRFQGQYYDKETGLHYNRYRYYEPYSARYVSKDPIGLNGGLNNSVYVLNTLRWIDPMGLQLWDGTEEVLSFDLFSKGKYNLKSQCIDKYEVEVEVDTIALGTGKGLAPGGRTKGGIQLYDNNATIYPDGLKGAWGGTAANASAGGKGAQYGVTALGSAVTNIQFDTNTATTNAGVGMFLGKVVRVKETWKYCGLNEPPKCGPNGCFDKRRSNKPASSHFNPAPIARPTVKEKNPPALDMTPPSKNHPINIQFPF
ncbi:RHS repeat domain-containing protein, partial [Acinetobacter bereziniae]|uniref:RHS repeat domain-containing protein n=2 Tax=Acinetobacter bereziniae TaxID=106648 RepID=UPI0021CEC965